MLRDLGIAIGLALVAACFTDGGKPSDAGVEAGDVTVLGEPAALFSRSCALTGCHVGADAPFHLDLSPNAFYASLVDVPSSEGAGVLRVKPGTPTDTQSYLLCKVDPECKVIGQHMPLGGPALASEDVATLRSWVASLPPDDAGPPLGSIDVTGPTFAGASSATPGPSSITLAWAPATDDVTPQSEIVYGIFQSTTSHGEYLGAPLAYTPPGATSYAVGSLAPSTTYYFIVLAYDWAHNDDGLDLEISATTPSTTDTTRPTFAGASTAVTKSPGSVTITWPAASDDVSQPAAISYSVFASSKSGGEDFQSPDVVTVAGATSATVTDLGGDTLYYFVVRARDQAGNVDTNTTEVSATTAHVGFTSDVAPIFLQACTASYCHAGANAAESIDLSTPQAAHTSLVSVVSSQCNGLTLAEPYKPNASYLLQKLRGHGSCFVGWQMPEQATPLTPAQIDLTSAWIGKGAPLD
jgi:hypothetical protein